MKQEYISKSIDDTKEIAEKLVQYAKPNFYFLLSGDLGAGKTTFTKEFLKLLKVDEQVTSPTFVILNQYETSDMIVNHVDAYRLSKNDDIDMYLEEFEDAFNIIEWYENIDLNLSKEQYIKIYISHIDENTRKFEMEIN